MVYGLTFRSSEVDFTKLQKGIDCTGVGISHLFSLDVHVVSLRTRTAISSQ